MGRADWIPILSGEDRSLGASLTRLGLSCATPFYRAAVVVRNGLFNVGVKRAIDLGRPTVSVGNITTGGTGKTPMVIEIARRLRAMGHTPAVLTRGYGADESQGKESDEAREVAEALDPPIPVGVDPDRVRGAQRVLNEHGDVTAFILDDGFQHRRAKRDLDIVLIDRSRPFGFDRLLPRGLLREPVSALRRADAVVVTRTNLAVGELGLAVELVTGNEPLACAVDSWTVWLDQNDEALPIDAMRGRQVAAVTGIGNPAAFRQELTEHHGVVVIADHVFDDHEPYEDRDVIERLAEDAAKRGADAIVTTQKDWVKLRSHVADGSISLPVYRPRLTLQFDEAGDARIGALLRERLGRPEEQG